jgi:hypothetical protein
VIDPFRCMALRDGEPTGGARCQEPATHQSAFGRRCARHAEQLRRTLRSPNAFCNVMLGRARTEEEIARAVMELPS